MRGNSSKFEGGVEIDVYSKSIGIYKSMGIPDHCSVFQAEVTATWTDLIVDKNVHKRRITILSDSQAAVKALDSSVISSRTVYDCRRCINEMPNRYEVCIVHRDTGIFSATLDLMIWPEGARKLHSLRILRICRLIIDNAIVDLINRRWAAWDKGRTARKFWAILDLCWCF